MFLPNDVYQWENRRIRILWVQDETIIWIDIDQKNAFPIVDSLADFGHYQASDIIVKIDDPYIDIALNAPRPGSRDELVQERAWAAIKSAVEQRPEIFIRKSRGLILQSVLAEHDITKQTAYRYLRNYWQFGNCKNALSGRYSRCGGLGKNKDITDRKNGRTRSKSPGEGVIVTEDIKKTFRRAIEVHYLNEKKNSFEFAYNQMLFSMGIKLPCSEETLSKLPTIRQFRYFYKKEYCGIEITRRREGAASYNKDHRPVLSTSTAEASGPGGRYQIDATIGDIYLVSEKDRSKIIGRPVIYFVADVYSRMITGMNVGLENPSWIGAMEALSNTIADKKQYCEKFGISINEEDWPSSGLPEVIIGDKGEILGRHIEILSKAFNIDIENTPAFRPDWKGIVERHFRTIQEHFKPYVEGYVTKATIGKKKNAKDYRLEAKLTLNDFTKLLINIVLFYNKDSCVSTYDPDQDMPTDMPHTPINIWNWGIQNLTGALRKPPADLVRINLLPHTKASISELGVKVFGCYYSCMEAVKLGWFEGNSSGPRKIEVAYEPTLANRIYIRPNDKYSDYWQANLTDRSREFEGLTMWEVWQRTDTKAKAQHAAQLKKRAGAINLAANIKELIEKANSDSPDLRNESKASRLKGIKENRFKERDLERKRNIDDHAEKNRGKGTSNIAYLAKPQQKTSFEIPVNIEDLLDEGEDQ